MELSVLWLGWNTPASDPESIMYSLKMPLLLMEGTTSQVHFYTVMS